jgi:hypothetical protein
MALKTWKEMRAASGLSSPQLREMGFQLGPATLPEVLERFRNPMFSEEWSLRAQKTWSEILGFPDMDPAQAWRAWWGAGDQITDEAAHRIHKVAHELAVEATRAQLLRDLEAPRG